MALNFGNIEKAVTAQKSNRVVGASWLRISDGETVRIRFVGGPNEPFQIYTHWLNRKNSSFICSQGWQGHEGCVICHYQSQDRAIGSRNPRLLFTVVSDRWIAKQVEDYGNETRTRYLPAEEGTENAFREGKRYWEMSVSTAQALQAEDVKLRKRCGSCGLGKIKNVGYDCSYCGEPLGNLPEGATNVSCPGCNKTTAPHEVIECSNCDEPIRRSITDCWVEVTRTGTGKDTRYAFDPEPPSPLDDEDQKIEPFNFREIKKPKDANEQAALLGYQNPFGPGTDHVGSATDESIFPE